MSVAEEMRNDLNAKSGFLHSLTTAIESVAAFFAANFLKLKSKAIRL